jgi:hypothetical protein
MYPRIAKIILQKTSKGEGPDTEGGGSQKYEET